MWAAGCGALFGRGLDAADRCGGRKGRAATGSPFLASQGEEDTEHTNENERQWEQRKEKLGVDFRKYLILGACDPKSAHRALQAEDKIGVLLPCNVIVQETADAEVEIAAMDPSAMMESIDNRALSEIAQDVRDRLAAALDKV